VFYISFFIDINTFSLNMVDASLKKPQYLNVYRYDACILGSRLMGEITGCVTLFYRDASGLFE
jgi:hypothetical protein